MICYSHLLKPITSVRSLARSHRPRAIVGSPSVSHARPHLSLVEPPGHHTVVPTASVSTLTSPTPPRLSFCVHAEARLPYPTVVRSSFGLFSAAIIQTLMFTNIRARKHNAGYVHLPCISTLRAVKSTSGLGAFVIARKVVLGAPVEGDCAAVGRSTPIAIRLKVSSHQIQSPFPGTSGG